MADNSNGENDLTLDVEETQDNSEQELDELTKERYKQQIAGSKAEVERQQAEAQKAHDLATKAAIKAAKLDGSTLLELYDEDPKFAEKVAKDGFNMTIDEVRAYMYGDDSQGMKKQSSSSSETDEEKFEKWYAERSKKEQHESSLKLVEKQFAKLPDDDLRSKAMDKFKLLADGKQLTPETATELAEMATLYVSKGNMKADAYNEFLKSMSSTGVSGKANVKKSNADDDGGYIIGGKFYPGTNK